MNTFLYLPTSAIFNDPFIPSIELPTFPVLQTLIICSFGIPSIHPSSSSPSSLHMYMVRWVTGMRKDCTRWNSSNLERKNWNHSLPLRVSACAGCIYHHPTKRSRIGRRHTKPASSFHCICWNWKSRSLLFVAGIRCKHRFSECLGPPTVPRFESYTGAQNPCGRISRYAERRYVRLRIYHAFWIPPVRGWLVTLRMGAQLQLVESTESLHKCWSPSCSPVVWCVMEYISTYLRDSKYSCVCWANHACW